MAKKGFRVTFDSPVVIVFVVLSIGIWLLNIACKQQLIPLLCQCHGLRGDGTVPPFSVKNALDYVRLFFHVFGNGSWAVLLVNASFVLLLGPTLEERYGSPVIALMMTMAALVSGVLTVCAGTLPLTGADSIIFMLIILSSLTAFAKKTVPLSWILLFLCYTGYRVYAMGARAEGVTASLLLKNNLPTFIDLAGGICGSLFGFFIVPQKRRAAKSVESHASDETIVIEDVKKKRGKAKKVPLEEESIVGSIEF